MKIAYVTLLSKTPQLKNNVPDIFTNITFPDIFFKIKFPDIFFQIKLFDILTKNKIPWHFGQK